MSTLPVAFGWCLTGHHSECPKRLLLTEQQTTAECYCECHGEQR